MPSTLQVLGLSCSHQRADSSWRHTEAFDLVYASVERCSALA